MSGRFITFEGPEGAGKTTQLALLADRLRALGEPLCVTREPGGTKGGEAVRAALLSPEAHWSPLAEMLLMNAARDAHLHEVILPALNAGETVLCDRFCDSTRAYQGGGGGLDPELVSIIEQNVCTRMPDLTLVFDLDAEEGLARADSRGARDRFEQKGLGYHRAVREAFRAIAASEPRAVLIDAIGAPDEVAERIRRAIATRFPDLGAL